MTSPWLLLLAALASSLAAASSPMCQNTLDPFDASSVIVCTACLATNNVCYSDAVPGGEIVDESWCNLFPGYVWCGPTGEDGEDSSPAGEDGEDSSLTGEESEDGEDSSLAAGSNPNCQSTFDQFDASTIVNCTACVATNNVCYYDAVVGPPVDEAWCNLFVGYTWCGPTGEDGEDSPRLI